MKLVILKILTNTVYYQFRQTIVKGLSEKGQLENYAVATKQVKS